MPLRRTPPLISVVVPAYDVSAYLPACLDSVLAQSHRELDVIVVDDGSPDESGAIAESYAERDDRVRVVHIENRGLGGARNEGIRHARGDVLAFADSDDVVPQDAYRTMLRQMRRTGADLVTGDVARLVGDDPRRIGWMQKSHARRAAVVIEQVPELLGDVFAWNKLFDRGFWERAGLSWAEGVRYEDQPTLTRAYVHARLIGVVPDVVYHWRVREDGTSITQARADVTDLRDRWTTKRDSLDTVLEFGSRRVNKVFVDGVLAGDLWRYFRQIPQADDEWWDLLVAGVRDIWGTKRSLTNSGLPPAYRLTGWLVEQNRRADAVAVMEAVAALEGKPLPRVRAEDGSVRIEVPGLDLSDVADDAVSLREDES